MQETFTERENGVYFKACVLPLASDDAEPLAPSDISHSNGWTSLKFIYRRLFLFTGWFLINP